MPQRNAMVGVAKLAEATLGTDPVVDGLVVSATAPASLAVRVGSGQIYSYAALDPSAYGALPADTQHLVVKQGVLLDPLTLAITPPATAGFAQWFLIQVAFQERDEGAQILPYYNADNPAQALSGPANSGEQQYTQRNGRAVVQVKAGAPASNGSHQRPAADPGWVGLAWVNAINGSATIRSQHVVPVPDVPRLKIKMPNLAKIIGASVTTVTAVRQMLVEDTGMVVVDVGAFNGTIDLRLPPANAVPGVPIRFVFLGRYVTPASRRAVSFARIVPAGSDALDFSFVYVGPEDAAELVSDGVSSWRWVSARFPAHCVAVLQEAQSIPHNVATAVNFHTATQTVEFWRADAPSRITLPRHMRFRAAANISFVGNATGWRGAGLIVNGTGVGAGLGRTVVPAVAGGIETCFPLSGAPIGAYSGDYLQVMVTQTSGGALALKPGETWLALESLH